MAELILTLILGSIVAGLFLVIFLTLRRRSERAAAFREKRLPPREEPGLTLAEHLPRPGHSVGWAARMDRAFGAMIRRTGLGWNVEQALGWMALAGVVLAGALLLWREDLGLAGLGLVTGMGLALGVYLVLQARWRRQMQNQLPDILFLLSRSVRAGLSLQQALEYVAQHGPQPLGGELQRGVEQIKLGLTIPAALQGIARRVRLVDFDVFVTVVTLHRNLGGNLILLLERVAATTRDRNQFRGYFMAATALSRATSLCLAAGAPAIFLGYAIWQPGFVSRFLETATGMRLLVTGTILEVVGVIWVGVLLRIRY